VPTRTFTCNLCEAMCGLKVELDGAKVTSVTGDPDDVFSRGHICPKALGLKELLDDPDRLRQPLVDGKPASWEVALDRAARGLREIRRRHGRDAVALYVGNPVVHTHRSAFAAQLLTNALRTKNRFDPNSQDGNPRLYACMRVYGDALTIPVPDVDRTDFLLMLGANPAASNGSMMALGDPKTRFKAIRARGGKIVLVDPRRSESAAWADEHHFIRPGGDAALLCAMLHVIDPPALREIVRPFSPSRVAPAIGIDAATITRLAREFAAAKKAVVYARVGVCQAEFGPTASWLVEAINVVTGRFDREGGAMLPAPAADIGPLGRLLIGNKIGRWRSRVRGLPEFLGALPSAVMAEEMETPGDGQIRALVSIAGNPVLSTPNGARLERAIAGLEHVVAIDYYVNETTRHAHVVLPAKHVFEVGNYDLLLSRFTVRNVSKYNPPILSTGDDTRDDWSIAVELVARTLGLPRWTNRLAAKLPEQLLSLLLRLGPYRTSLRELAASEHGVDHGPLTPSGRKPKDLAPKEFVDDLARVSKWIDASRDGLVMIGRRHLRSNNSWMHNVKVLAKGPDRARLFMHPTDAARLSLPDGANVKITSRAGSASAILTITDEVMPGVVSMPHGFGHQAARETLRIAGALPGSSANAVTDELLVEPLIGTSILNGVPVTVCVE
jgi:anaerobic selenocysteine-containing dehydrogenase